MSAADADINFAAPVKSVSIDNMVRKRAAVAERFEQAIALLTEAGEIAASAHIGCPNLEIATHGRGRTGTALTSPEAREIILREIDRTAWSWLMNESGLRTFMDATARKQWDEQLHDSSKLPALTAENVAATFRLMHDTRGEMFERGVIACFKKLSWDYKTNKPFLFGKRIIIEWLFSRYGTGEHRWLSINHAQTDQLDDLVRVFCVLDRKPEPDHRNGVYRALADAQHEHRSECENEYFHLKWFLKGTGHVTFKRPDLVDKLNDILARNFPAALAAPR